MRRNSQATLVSERKRQDTLAVRFPSPPDARRLSNNHLPRLGDLLPRRWRRQVVIQGKRFWLPG